MYRTLHFIILHKKLQAFFRKKANFFHFIPDEIVFFAGDAENSKKSLTFLRRYAILVSPLYGVYFFAILQKKQSVR